MKGVELPRKKHMTHVDLEKGDDVEREGLIGSPPIGVSPRRSPQRPSKERGSLRDGDKSDHDRPGQPEESVGKKAAMLVFCILGLQGSYLTWGFLQEIIMKTSYAPDGEEVAMFPSSVFIVFGNRALALLAAAFLVYSPFGKARTTTSPRAPMLQFAPCSISNVLSSWAQYECLRYISFPMQVVSKSCKVIPVMLVGKFVHSKSYPWIEYIEAFAITAGVSMFSLAESGNKSDDTRTTEFWGLMLVAMYLTCDSFTSQWQDRIFRTYKIDQYQMMFGINCFSMLFTGLKLVMAGEIWTCLDFMAKYPAAFTHICILSLTSATGQLFIFFTIKKYGPIVFTIIMTCRQMMSMVISCMWFGHPLGVLSVCGALVVFGTLGYRIKRKLDGGRKG